MNITNSESTYRLDEIGTYGRFAGSSEKTLVQVNSPGSIRIFNCDVPIHKWSKEPKIGDKIKYEQISVPQYPFETIRIFINDEMVFEKEDETYRYGMNV